MTLEHVDTAIAFAVIMLGASLLIMIFTQGVSTLLNLRGAHLQRALQDLLGTLYPEQVGRAEEITREILEHPLLSDSAFGSGFHGNNKGPYRKFAALGACVFAAAFSWVFFDTTHTLMSTGLLVAMLGVLVLVVVVVYRSSNRWELATAVRKEEFFGMLEKLSVGKSAAAPAMAEIATKLRAGGPLGERLAGLESLAGSYQQALDALQKALLSETADAPVLELLRRILAKTDDAQQRRADVEALRKLVDQKLHATVDKILKLIEDDILNDANRANLMTRMKDATEHGLGNVETMFNAAMDRASQRFALWSRVITVLLSVAFAFVAHLDAIKLFKRLSSDAELRAKLVASSDAMMNQADKIINASHSPPGTPPANDAAASPPNDAGAPPPSDAGALAASPPSPASKCLDREKLRARVPGVYVAAMLCPERVEPFKLARVKDWEKEKKSIGPFATREDALADLTKRVTDLQKTDPTLDSSTRSSAGTAPIWVCSSKPRRLINSSIRQHPSTASSPARASSFCPIPTPDSPPGTRSFRGCSLRRRS